MPQVGLAIIRTLLARSESISSPPMDVSGPSLTAEVSLPRHPPTTHFPRRVITRFGSHSHTVSRALHLNTQLRYVTSSPLPNSTMCFLRSRSSFNDSNKPRQAIRWPTVPNVAPHGARQQNVDPAANHNLTDAMPPTCGETQAHHVLLDRPGPICGGRSSPCTAPSSAFDLYGHHHTEGLGEGARCTCSAACCLRETRTSHPTRRGSPQQQLRQATLRSSSSESMQRASALSPRTQAPARLDSTAPQDSYRCS